MAAAPHVRIARRPTRPGEEDLGGGGRRGGDPTDGTGISGCQGIPSMSSTSSLRRYPWVRANSISSATLVITAVR